MKIFVSYCSRQGKWVWDRLVPVLKAAVGPDNVLIDRERFKAGVAVYKQMDVVQDLADRQVLCLSADYYASDPCRHEMNRAIALDPGFADERLLPLRLDGATLPPTIAIPDPLWIDMRDDRVEPPWKLVLDGCGGNLGTEAPSWLEAMDSCVYYLGGSRSIVVQVAEQVSSLCRDRLVEELAEGRVPKLALIDMSDPRAYSREGFIRSCCRAFGLNVSAMRTTAPHDLADFTEAVLGLPSAVSVALQRFERVARHPESFNADFFDTLRWLIEKRRLVLLIDTRAHLSSLLPRDHWLSNLTLTTVELR